jgi:hypothetical protein
MASADANTYAFCCGLFKLEPDSNYLSQLTPLDDAHMNALS